MKRTAQIIRNRLNHHYVLAVVLGMLFTSHAIAVTTSWNQLVDGDFLNAGNWDNGLPGASDSANFNNDFTGTVEFGSSHTTQDLFLQNSTGTITLDVDPDDTDNIYEATRFVIVGAGAGQTNNLVQISGEIVTGIFFLGNNDGAVNNTAVIDGAGTILRGTGGASGTVADIRIGSNGGDNSSLTVSGGASVISSTTTIIGLQGANNGQLTVTGSGSYFETGSLQLGDNTTPLGPQSNNNAEVLAGATMTTERFIIGVTSPSPNNTLTVSGAGSTISLDPMGADSDIGRASVGNTLLIENGGRVDGGAQFVVGRDETSTGNLVSVTSSGQMLGTSIEVLRGKLLVDSGSVEFSEVFDEDPLVNAYVSGDLLVDNGSDSEIEFNSGLIATVNATINNGAVFTVGDGSGVATYRMKPSENGGNGTHSFSDGLFLEANSTLAGSGDIQGNISAAAGASVDIGASPGQINITGDFDSTGITIDVGLEDLAASLDPGIGFDQLNVAGAFTHGGSVVIDSSGLTLPASETSIKVLGWTSEVGSSASTSVSFIGDALSYSFMSDGLFIDIPAGGGLDGDLNGDGFVGVDDLNIVLVNWNQTIPPGDAAADPSGDDYVGVDDLNIVLVNWNNGTPPSEGSNVPEPASCLLFVMSGLFVHAGRRGNR